MRITDLLSPESICLNGRADSKKDALDQIVDLMARSGRVQDVEKYRRGD